MLRDIGGVRVSDRYVALEEDALASAAGVAVKPATDGGQSDAADSKRAER
jgi:hypothetical protein